jgi:hypothetical protein
VSPRSRRRGGGGSQRRRKAGGRGNQRQTGAGFWGEAEQLPESVPEVRISEDPAAVVRSLGQPPLAGHEIIAEAYFTAVYDRAVTLAGALATAAGLISAEELADDDSD